MRIIRVIVLGAALLAATGPTFAQFRIGGHGGGVGPAAGDRRGGGPPPALSGSGRGGPEANGDRRGPRAGIGGPGGGSIGIGSSRVNSAISSQGRGRGGRFR